MTEFQPYKTPFKNNLFRVIFRPVFRCLFHLLSRVQVTGKEYIPKSGAYIVTTNHVSLFDPPFVLAFWPIPLEVAGAVDIWDRVGQSTLVRCYGGIPVHRQEFDRALIETLLRVLHSDMPLMIAPEGGRSHDLGMRRAFPGAAYLAEKTGAQIVPVGIVGAHDNFLRDAIKGHRQSLEMHIGKPFNLPPSPDTRQARRIERQKKADLIMGKIAELLPPEYHGVYAKKISPTADNEAAAVD